MNPFLFSSMALLLLLLEPAAASIGTGHLGRIGAVVDNSSRIGKEEIVAMELAIQDFQHKTNRQLVLHVANSQSDPLLAMFSARDLIKKRRVEAIVGAGTWEETSFVAEVGSRAGIPIVSLSDANPWWARDRWPFLVEASRDKHLQMAAVAAIVGSWGWRWINVIYEDTNSAATDIIPCLADALKEVGSEIGHLEALPPFSVLESSSSSSSSSSSLSDKLEWLKGKQSKVFVVHSSLTTAVRLFQKANELGMMEKGYVWIITDRITSLVHCLNSSIILSMEGVLGVKSYFPESGPQFQDFYLRFRKKFNSMFPSEDNHEPGIFAVQAYDAVSSVARAMEAASSNQQLLQLIEQIKFHRRGLSPQREFQVINLIGKSYRELGFWSVGSGFSRTRNKHNTYNNSMKILGQVFWPGATSAIPSGWALPTSEKLLKIGVPLNATFKQFVSITYDPDRSNYSVSGFSIDVFQATLKHLKYYLPHEFLPFNGTYDDLVEQVHLKKFDAVVGDVSIVSRRWEHAEFSHPYSEPGLVMIVPAQLETSKEAWLLFMKPFTTAMWLLTGAITVYNGFTIWLIERNHSPELMTGSVLNQTGTLICMSFTTLFSLHGEKLHSNLSRLAMVVWLFVSLIITTSYTANLTSMLTVQRLEPTVVDVEYLKSTNAIVGCSGRSFVARYLVDVIGIELRNIKNITAAEEYTRALSSGEIAAAFIESPYAKVFLAQNCKGFVASQKTYKVGGFGFVFPKGSPILPDISEAVLEMSERGELRDLENKLIGSQKCDSNAEASDDNSRLSLRSFWVLFLITGGISTVCLVIFEARERFHLYNFMLGRISIWRMISALMRQWRSNSHNRFSRRIRDLENHGNTQEASMHSPNFGYRIPWQRN